ncbi:phospholipase D-like domain-containing protein [Curtobacterium sp. MCSS17_016]|uniref:phospholipase D-like domain-containing protein n=1 Tax=Curtobacterium sp. MCSS17_016 TaxID=2175644 RepID=UPI0011B60007|nr:phospholipase D-like domain-containing protein [Curtobacterium sp. MCSS17_016]WIE80878.1 phospholipase D-like domain-containing protein [Curtobacterium sp. MCSS17_016]
MHFTGITDKLLDFIRGSDAIVGCVAWVTNRDVIGALAERPVALIVNKEYALRSTDRKVHSQRQRQNLSELRGGLRRQDFPAPLRDIPTGPDSIEPVRCVGHITRGTAGNTPLMHSKFIVRLQRGKPVAVWTGSFNFTVNAASNVENVVEIHDKVIAQAYLDEFARIAALSEPLEFKAGKADPAWGTVLPKRTPTAATGAAAKKLPRKPAATTKNVVRKATKTRPKRRK